MKEVAKSLVNVFNHPTMKIILDRAQDVKTASGDVLDWWRSDIFSRKPAPALVNGEYQGTDLDLSTFMLTLADRGAVINIPQYKSMRGATLKEGQVLVSKENRHGRISGLTANQDVFTFGVRIKDMNVMTTDSVGDFRVFNLVDLNGDWYPGWKKIEFIPTNDENDFIKEFQIAYGKTIIFSDFVHPARKNSIFGAPYFITKVLIERLTEESKYLQGIINDMISLGIRYPKGGEPKVWPEVTKVGEEKSIEVPAFEVEIDTIDFINEYPHYKYSQEMLKLLTDVRRDIIYHLKPMLTFAVRSCELAYKKYNTEKMPSWIKGTDFQSSYKTPKRINISSSLIKKYEGTDTQKVLKMMSERSFYSVDELTKSFEYYNTRENGIGTVSKTSFDTSSLRPTAGKKEWNRLILFQPSVGEFGVSIRTRDYVKSERVSENY